MQFTFFRHTKEQPNISTRRRPKSNSIWCGKSVWIGIWINRIRM